MAPTSSAAPGPARDRQGGLGRGSSRICRAVGRDLGLARDASFAEAPFAGNRDSPERLILAARFGISILGLPGDCLAPKPAEDVCEPLSHALRSCLPSRLVELDRDLRMRTRRQVQLASDHRSAQFWGMLSVPLDESLHADVPIAFGERLQQAAAVA